ncbi:hypothetical protein GCM10010306_082830 [Streptomyces umbrinus]|nr:hypothetical protein GCM10010306_082830 [Streptomyces umbrinus]
MTRKVVTDPRNLDEFANPRTREPYGALTGGAGPCHSPERHSPARGGLPRGLVRGQPGVISRLARYAGRPSAMSAITCLKDIVGTRRRHG